MFEAIVNWIASLCGAQVKAQETSIERELQEQIERHFEVLDAVFSKVLRIYEGVGDVNQLLEGVDQDIHQVEASVEYLLTLLSLVRRDPEWLSLSPSLQWEIEEAFRAR